MVWLLANLVQQQNSPKTHLHYRLEDQELMSSAYSIQTTYRLSKYQRQFSHIRIRLSL